MGHAMLSIQLQHAYVKRLSLLNIPLALFGGCLGRLKARSECPLAPPLFHLLYCLKKTTATAFLRR
jgi:hypothetical protein